MLKRSFTTSPRRADAGPTSFCKMHWGRVKPIDSEEAFARLRAKTESAAQSLGMTAGTGFRES